MGRFLLLALALLLPAVAYAADDAFHVANWNVENLFDTVDDPDNPYDDEFLPNNPTTRWTRARFETKLDNLARVISGMNHGQGPDLLGLQEVENRYVLEELAPRLPAKPYGIVHYDSPDPRGIDTALLYNRDLFTLRHSQALPVALKWNRDTRDILQTVFEDRHGHILHVLVNHWPSRGGGPNTEFDRFTAARTLAKTIERIFQRDSNAQVIVLGDFNDEPASQSIRVVLDVHPFPSRSGYRPTALYNLASRHSAQGWGSFFHSFRGDFEWRMYDQIIVSGSLLGQARIETDEAAFWIDKPAYMQDAGGRDKGSPVPTFEGQEFYRGGFSDHFPIGARFVFQPPAPSPERDRKPPAPPPDANAPVRW